MTASTIPAAIDALLVQLRAVADDSVRVVDGYPRFALTNMDLIAVGGTREAAATGVQVAEDVAGGRQETYALQIRTSSSRGVGVEQKVVRDRAFELMALVEEALGLDTTLGGTVYLAEVGGDVDLFQTNAETARDGTHAQVNFFVLVQAGV